MPVRGHETRHRRSVGGVGAPRASRVAACEPGGVEFDAVVRGRRMVRDFDPAPLPEPMLRRALERALRAPSAGFSQGLDLVLLVAPEDRDRFWTATVDAEAAAPGSGPRSRWLTGVRRAPALIVVCSDPGAYVRRYARADKAVTGYGAGVDAWPIPYWDVDAGMAALLLLLGAVDDGIGGLFLGVPPARHDAVRAALAIPAGRRLVGVVALGRPRADAARPGSRGGSHRPDRRPFEEVVHVGRFARHPPQGRAGAAPPV